MSYVDTGDDELDYGEGELGDAAAAGVSLGAPADDDEMAQEDEYDDLYDDVNIGYFEAPPIGAVDLCGTGSLDQNTDVKSNDVVADLDTRAMEHTKLDPSLAPTAEIPKSLKIEANEEFNDDKGMPAIQDVANRNSGQQKESGSVPLSATDMGHGRQLQLFLSPSSREQGPGYNNGVRQGVSYLKTSSGATASGDGDHVSGSVVVPHSGRPGSGFSVGPSRAAVGAGETFKERGDAEDLSYDRTSRPTSGVPRTVQKELPSNLTDNTSRQLIGTESASRPMMQQPYSGDGNGMVFVGDLQWWTTDAELEAALSEYGRVKNLKFYEERVSGKSKGYCQVEFFDHASAVACKQGMNGRKFHDRPCIVALGNPKSIQQMGYQQEKKTQAQFQAQQEQMTARRSNNVSGGARGGPSYQDRDNSRGYGRTGTGRLSHAQGMGNRTGQGSGRGRGNYMNKGMSGGSGGSGMYGQGHSGPMAGHQSAMMMHQGMMGQGYDPTYGPMGRGGAGYGGYVMPGPPFPGMVTPFPSLGPGGLPGVAPHVNPAFFGRPNGMGMMPGGSMEGPHQGMWGDASLGGWGGEEHDRRARDGSYGEDAGGMDYSYNSDVGYEKSRAIGGWDKENGGLPERHRRDDRDGEWERDVYKERDRDAYRDRDRFRDRDEDWDRERTIKSRSKSRIAEEEDDPRPRLREDDYGRKRRISDRELSNMMQPAVAVEMCAGVFRAPLILGHVAVGKAEKFMAGLLRSRT